MARVDFSAALRDFAPPHCPNPDCPCHFPTESGYRLFVYKGYRRIRRAPGLVRLMRCLVCKRFFRSSAFSDEYWKKLNGMAGKVFTHLNEGQSLRQAARTLGVSKTTVWRTQRWLAKQGLLLQRDCLRRLAGRLMEPVVLDAQRTYANSRFEVVDADTPITKESGFQLGIEAIPLRRSGTLSPQQLRTRSRRERRLGRPPRGIRARATRRGFEQLLRLPAPGLRLVLHTDEQTDYANAVRQLGGASVIDHRTISSKARRDEAGHPLWQVNHLHRLQRHAAKALARRTLAFCKTMAGLVDRLLLQLCWRNHTKGVSERTLAGRLTTPAMRLGLAEARRSGAQLFARRRFPGHYVLSEHERAVYEGRLRGRPRELVSPYMYKVAY